MSALCWTLAGPHDIAKVASDPHQLFRPQSPTHPPTVVDVEGQAAWYTEVALLVRLLPHNAPGQVRGLHSHSSQQGRLIGLNGPGHVAAGQAGAGGVTRGWCSQGTVAGPGVLGQHSTSSTAAALHSGSTL